MKTVQSYTKNHLGKLLVDLAIKQIDRWAINELAALSKKSDFPIYVPISDKSWLVGEFTIDHLEDNKWHLAREGKMLHVFYSKQAAVFYSIFDKFHMFDMAADILNADRKVALSSDELVFYTKKLSKKQKKKDDFKQQLWTVRRSEARLRFKCSKEELAKKLNSNKYIKVWDQIL